MGAQGEVKYEELVIVGAGICGLATALAFHRYDQLTSLSVLYFVKLSVLLQPYRLTRSYIIF